MIHTFLLQALLNPDAKKPPNGPSVAANTQMNAPCSQTNGISFTAWSDVTYFGQNRFDQNFILNMFFVTLENIFYILIVSSKLT